jgi:hypothetical protein
LKVGFGGGKEGVVWNFHESDFGMGKAKNLEPAGEELR